MYTNLHLSPTPGRCVLHAAGAPVEAFNITGALGSNLQKYVYGSIGSSCCFYKEVATLSTLRWSLSNRLGVGNFANPFTWNFHKDAAAFAEEFCVLLNSCSHNSPCE